MKIRKRPSPLLLLLLPTLVVSLSASVQSSDVASASPSLAAKAVEVADATSAQAGSVSPSTKPDKGTKDAPVDGLDGKPHAGPFVDSSPEKPNSKPAAAVEEVAPIDIPPVGPGQKGRPTKEEIQAAQEFPGVMDDKNRDSPKKGTTGTEGGVTEKDKERKAKEHKSGEKVEKRPETPKEAPPLPESDDPKPKAPKEKVVDKEVDAEKPKGAVGLEIPTDLPEKPHDIPHPVPPHQADEKLGSEPPVKKPVSTEPLTDEPNGVIRPFHSFVLSLTMILFSEVGDKTFLVAALMAMRHPRMVVFSAAFSALIAMTVLSAVLGHAVPTLLPERFVHFAAAILFLVFGAKLMREGYAMSPHEGVGEEMREVEAELEEKEHLARRNNRRNSNMSPYMLESGRGRRSRSDSRLPAPRSPSSSRSPSPARSSVSSALSGLNNLFSLLLSPAWVQTFIMTFLGEWGDRSQIATIAMAAGQDYWWVTGGAIVGHGCCTAAAVLGGRAVAGKVSMRVVTLGGAFAFVAFGIIYLFEAAYHE
ncbi:UPF0016-domain-containing protein [Aulographum hederae CBS 113979]|uniref:UPF0016-domain-containing protein n=1 Tax=Aulographum hederae CBS 113979 TaxID=1176131 RepID=A0A6G1H2E2_9PEZI|nr:UPF0016-domain-containing protein [Aulographum hederae CBS 113979]